MQIIFKILDLLLQSNETLSAVSTLLSQSLTILDSAGLDEISLEQLELLLDKIPSHWSWTEIQEFFDSSTLSDSFKEQLKMWLQRRLNRSDSTTTIIKDSAQLTGSSFDPN